MNDLLEILKKNKFDRYLNKLNKKLKNKTVIIYGTGSLFRAIIENYDISGLNIIGVSDGKYLSEEEGKLDYGYKVIPLDSITRYKPDYVLVSTLKVLNIISNFKNHLFKGSKIKFLPFMDKPFKDLLKEIFEY